MKIIVPIKQILDPSGITFRRDKERMFINREEYILDPGSKAALEAALRLKEQADGGASESGWSVVALALGEPHADDALREALAMGCDAAYLVTDPAFKDADISVTVQILAAAIDKLGRPDLIVAGRESGDTGAGQVGARLAEALDYAGITDVYALAVDRSSVRATRRWGTGYAAVRAPLPAAVTVAPEAFPPRLPHGARIMSAYREWDVPVWGLEDLDLTEADLSPRLALRREGFPPPLETGEVYRGDPDSVAQELVIALRLQKLIS
ncbi:MAG: electron transfer flavoprotein subunit beta/FixA family protein [Anaerolineae bacterium]|jgi:electron transfer flavoprotein beta subunit